MGQLLWHEEVLAIVKGLKQKPVKTNEKKVVKRSKMKMNLIKGGSLLGKNFLAAGGTRLSGNA
jgi:hypothetical protein